MWMKEISMNEGDKKKRIKNMYVDETYECG